MRASVVQFRVSLYMMRQNWTFELNVMTIWISQELPLFNSERLVMGFAWIGYPCEKLWPFEFLKSFCCSISSLSTYYAPESDIRVKSDDHLSFTRAFVVQFRASRHIMRPNRTSVWKVMTSWIFRELLLFNFERLYMWYVWIGHPSEKLRPFEFLDSFCCSISSVSTYFAPESDIRVKSDDQLNFSRASDVKFRASWYIIILNRTSVWIVMTIWISLELPLFIFERLNMWCARIRHPSSKLWPSKFLKNFRCSILSVSICDAP